MESSIATFLLRWSACELLPTDEGRRGFNRGPDWPWALVPVTCARVGRLCVRCARRAACRNIVHALPPTFHAHTFSAFWL